MNETQDVITLVDFDVFLESNNLSSESFYAKSHKSGRSANSHKYMKYKDGIIVRQKSHSANVNPTVSTLSQEVSKPKNTDNIPVCFRNFPPEHKSHANSSSQNNQMTPLTNTFQHPKSHQPDYSTDYSYNYYIMKNNDTSSNTFTDESILTNSVITQKKVVNSVLQNYESKKLMSSSKYFTLKDEDPETIRKKLTMNQKEDFGQIGSQEQHLPRGKKVPVSLTSGSNISLKKMSPFWFNQAK